MQSWLLQIVSLVFAPVVIVSGVGYLLKVLFNQMLARDVKTFEANLNSELEIAKARLQSELNAQLFEFQTRFSFHHQKQTEVIGRTYELLVEAYKQVAELVHPAQLNYETPEIGRVERAGKAYNELADYYTDFPLPLRKF